MSLLKSFYPTPAFLKLCLISTNCNHSAFWKTLVCRLLAKMAKVESRGILMIKELATFNLFIILRVVFGGFAVIRIVKSRLEE